MPLYNFMEQFAPKVAKGEKNHTIRAPRKRPTKAGDTLYLYTNLRHKTKTAIKLKEAVCTKVLPIEIYTDMVVLDGMPLDRGEIEALAVSDGFKDSASFFAFWQKHNGVREGHPANMEIIYW